jgi:hypothetical protein
MSVVCRPIIRLRLAIWIDEMWISQYTQWLELMVARTLDVGTTGCVSRRWGLTSSSLSSSTLDVGVCALWTQRRLCHVILLTVSQWSYGCFDRVDGSSLGPEAGLNFAFLVGS